MLIIGERINTVRKHIARALEIKDGCGGIHIMTIHWEDKVPLLLEAASLI